MKFGVSSFLVAALITAVPRLQCQSALTPPTTALTSHPDWPKALPADVATPISTVQAFYDAISDPIVQKRD